MIRLYWRTVAKKKSWFRIRGLIGRLRCIQHVQSVGDWLLSSNGSARYNSRSPPLVLNRGGKVSHAKLNLIQSLLFRNNMLMTVESMYLVYSCSKMLFILGIVHVKTRKTRLISIIYQALLSRSSSTINQTDIAVKPFVSWCTTILDHHVSMLD